MCEEARLSAVYHPISSPVRLDLEAVAGRANAHFGLERIPAFTLQGGEELPVLARMAARRLDGARSREAGGLHRFTAIQPATGGP